MEKKLGIITGTGFYRYPEIEGSRLKVVDTPFGSQQIFVGNLEGRPIAWIPRHGLEHEKISTKINPRAIIYALKEIGVSWIIGITAVGIIDKYIPLARPVLFNDLFFITNTLPDGSPCTFFTPKSKKSGHFVFDKPISPGLTRVVKIACKKAGIELIEGDVFAQTMGPRLETAAEIRFLSSVGATAVSMAAGYEIVLSGEMEIPYLNLGFGINYATGVMPWPSASEEMEDNIKEIASQSKKIVAAVARSELLDQVQFDTGYVLPA